MAVNNNLYPGIVNTYMPAFAIKGSGSATCNIIFDLPQYNDSKSAYADIMNVQVTVSYQNNNKSALNRQKYPCEIMLTDLIFDASLQKYYIRINNDDLEGEKFEINQYYKVQFRFTGKNSTLVSIKTPQQIDSWLTSNLQNFSEWSTVCLIRAISTPRLSVSGLEPVAESTIWTTANTRVIGELTFSDPAEKETLKSYQIKLYNSDTRELVSDSGIQYTSDYVDINQFNYTFPYDFNEGQEYYLTVEYTTSNLYSKIDEYSFTVIQNSGGGKLDAVLAAKPDNENGRIEVNLEARDLTERFTGNISIRRASSKSHFQLWEDVYTTTFLNEPLQLSFNDYTVESGVWYKYCAQKRDSLGNRGIVLTIDTPVMINLEYFYLTANNKQIKFKFNHSISSFKRQISESKTDTIGSKYPFISRNAIVDYKTFPIAGTISYLMDENNIFTSVDDIFGEEVELYQEYNKKHRIGLYNDYIHEREFRDLVSDFLHENNIKLFRSATEGNILVKLMDINFTPNQTLGGYIYDFSCTAYEIADCIQENIDKYNIQPIGNFDTTLKYIDSHIGQSIQKFAANEEVLMNLEDKFSKYAQKNCITKIESFDTLKVNFKSEPYLIGENQSGPYVIDSIKATTDELSKAYLGYIIYINKEPIVINSEGIYELNGDNMTINSIAFPVDTEVELEYFLQLSQIEDKSKTYKSMNYFNRIGQCWGSFEYKDSISQQIWNKYYQSYSNYKQSMVALNRIRIEADPGTVVYVKELQDNDFDRHIIGETCTLDFDEEGIVIEGIYFGGKHLEEATLDEQDIIRNNKYINTGMTINSLSTNNGNLIKNGVYTLINTNDKYIWYNNQWFAFTEDADLVCPVEGLIDYHCEIMRGNYA